VIGALDQDSSSHSPTADMVRYALGRMLSVEPFVSSPQLSAFLQFIVDETLRGKGAELKGYTIATLALGRPADFDPQADPIVRVQAGRVRQALDEYYITHASDPVQIILEKGSYQPRFVLRALSIKNFDSATELGVVETTAAHDIPLKDIRSPVKEPILQKRQSQKGRDYSDRPFSLQGLLGIATVLTVITILAMGMNGFFASKPAPLEQAQRKSYFPLIMVEGETVPSESAELVNVVQRTQDALTRFDDIVLVRDRRNERGVSELQAVQNKAERLSLRIASNQADQGRIRFSARLVDPFDQQVIWVQEFDPVLTGPFGDAARTEIVRAIATTIARPYGAIHSYARQVFASSNLSSTDFGCIMISFDYWLKNDKETRLRSKECLEEQLTKTPNIGALHSQLAYKYLDEYRLSETKNPRLLLDYAVASANRGASLSPTSARSFQALFSVYFVRKEMENAWRAAEQAQKLNPFDTDILAEVGVRYIQAGQVEKGLRILDDNNLMSFNPPDWVVTYRSIALFMLDKADQAADNHRSLKNSEFPLAMIGNILVATREKDKASALAEINRLKRVHPDIYANPKAYFERINVDRRIATVFLDSLQAAYSGAN
jgi:tetratricopeptide (TPR) repeat protein